MRTDRTASELAHGRRLVDRGAEAIWGWATPAGRLRATRRAQWIADAAGLRPGVSALEIGCGTGLFTERFATSGASITGIDISPEMISMAERRMLPSHVQFRAVAVDAFIGPTPFDAVIGSSVLHHLEIRPALARIVDLLRPGGVVAFAEPNMLNPQIALQKNLPWVKKWAGDSPDETAFFRREIAGLLAQAGFVGIEVTPVDWLHPATPTAAIPVVRRLGALLEQTPLIREFAGSLHIRARRPS